jgi:predicted TIM-barrel fold metal-dependent hydrolase
MQIIDIHTHPEFYNRNKEPLSISEAVEMTVHHMDGFGVQLSGLLGYDVSPGQSEESVRKVNDHTAAMVAASPDRLFGFAFINPACSAGFIREELDRCLQTPGFLAIKLEIDVNCRSALLDPVMQKAIQYDLPVLHHSWYLNTWSMGPAEQDFQKGRSEPHDIADLARRFPRAKIIMAHLEGSGIRGVLDIADLENVWIDTSGSQPFSGTLEFAVETLGSSRILFGTDMLGRGMPSQLGRILGSRLTPEDRDNVLFRNARSLFRFQTKFDTAYENHRRQRSDGVLANPAVHQSLVV